MLFHNFVDALSRENSLPPTLYSVLNSIVNFDAETRTKISDLASAASSSIFDFNYPLSEKVDKNEFQTLILNKFMMRRIGFDTMTSFKIALNVKMNEIMPTYNKLFDALGGWNLFDDGEVLTRELTTTLNTNTTNTSSNTSDRRFSELPQNQLSNLGNGSYVTQQNLDNDTYEGSQNGNNSGTEKETVTRSATDKVALLNEFLAHKNNIMTMIFNDLDSLFYQII